MIAVTSVWVSRSDEEFENHLPLLWGGERMRRLDFPNGINLVFLEGLEQLSDNYKAKLAETGYILHDASLLWDELKGNYRTLDRFGDYEKRCFLRWLVFNKLFQNEPFIHFDADVIHNISPLELSRQSSGLTFVLQGCPAFTAVSDHDWSAVYSEELLNFTNNIEMYSDDAWKARQGWEVTRLSRWAGSRFRKIISSDQDLISHLIHTGRLPQADPSVVTTQFPYCLFTDPLYFHGYMPDLLPIVYERQGGLDYFNGQLIPFWHMQSDFVRYLAFCRDLQRIYFRGRVVNLLETFSVITLGWRLLRYCRGPLNRKDIYRIYFDESDFSMLFSADRFWREKVFV